MDSKLCENDKDEWIYNSLERYKNLYMFELEFPVDAIDVINDMSLCISGLQNYSKKCEILQLLIPPKILPENPDDEALCKDRDFTIISGGYTNSRILQIKGIPSTSSSPSLIATTQIGINGITLFRLGDSKCAIIEESSFLPLQEENGPGVITVSKDGTIAASGTFGTHLYFWTDDFIQKIHKLPKNNGRIIKLKFWEENLIYSCTENGFMSIYDRRIQDGLVQEILPYTKISSASTNLKISQTTQVQYSFDILPERSIIGRVDSNSYYESYDVRKLSQALIQNRKLLPILNDSKGTILGKFDLLYDPNWNRKFDSSSSETINNGINFVVNGFNSDIVQVYEDTGSEIKSLFEHDGHSKVVTHTLWHPTSKALLLSTSADAVLHAWQYQGNKESL